MIITGFVSDKSMLIGYSGCTRRNFTGVSSMNVSELVQTLVNKVEEIKKKEKLTRQEVDILMTYKQRIFYMLKMLEHESEISNISKLLQQGLSKEEVEKMLQTLETKRPFLDCKKILISEIDDISKPGVKYKAGQRKFSMSREFDFIILDLVNKNFENVQISTMFQLQKYIQLDEEIATFVKSVRNLYTVILKMDSLVFEAEVPRHLFEEYLDENIIIRDTLRVIGEEQDKLLKAYSDFVKYSDEERKKAISTKGPVVRIMRLTQKQLPTRIRYPIINRAVDETSMNLELKAALHTYKLQKLTELKVNGGKFEPEESGPLVE